MLFAGTGIVTFLAYKIVAKLKLMKKRPSFDFVNDEVSGYIRI